jgi:hypothetical protein
MLGINLPYGTIARFSSFISHFSPEVIALPYFFCPGLGGMILLNHC